MQNKGAIRLFAILMALACLFYLSFSLKTRGVENDAKAAAQTYADSKSVQDLAAKFANGDANRIKDFTDSVSKVREVRYLDSMRKVPIYNIGIVDFTYEDCKEKEINLGLDLRGGMNVTLEVSVADIIRAMSNKPDDPKLNQALKEAKQLEKKDRREFAVLFGESLKKIDAEHPLAYYFRSIDLKGKIDMKTSDEDVLKHIRETVDGALNTSEQTLRARIDRFGVTQPTIQKLESSGRLLIELPGVSDRQRVRKLLQGTANLEFWQTYDNTEVINYIGEANKELKYIITPSLKDSLNNDSLKNNNIVKKDTATNNVLAKDDSSKNQSNDLFAATDSTGKGTKSHQDSIQMMEKENPLFSIFLPSMDQRGTPAPGPIVGVCLTKDTGRVMSYLMHPKIRKIFPSNLKFMWGNKSPKYNDRVMQLYAIKVTDNKGRAALSGDIISSAGKTSDQRQGGNSIVEMVMKDEASQKWRVLTRDNSPQGGKPGHSIAIVLDNQVYSAPTVQGEIAGGRSQITGDFTPREADDLANILGAGKLPAPAKIVEEQIVGPTLGEDNIRDGFLSFSIALALVLLFMGFYYNKAGWVADVALFVNMFFIVGILASLGAVLTLPGIAGIVLTIGLSVDANILIFERVREELAEGKGVPMAIKEGYKNAMSSIIDSNVTTLLLGIILFAYGSGPVQGFATTLIIGILTSLFCAIFITRLIFDRMLSRNKEITFSTAATKNMFKNINIDFVGKRKIYYLFSAAIIVLGAVFYFKNGGFNLGVDFKGGRSYVIRFNDKVETDKVADALKVSFGERPEVKTYGTGNNRVKITTTYKIEEQGQEVDQIVESKLDEGLKTLNNNYTIDSQSKVGETISRDIKNSSFLVVLFSCLVMFVYIFIRFKKWQYGLGATIALVHDVAIVLSCYLIFDGILPFSLEIDQHFIAAILTVMGYSMTDTVVVFDRIREYLTVKNKKDLDPEEKTRVVNYALNSTLSRTINTSLTIFFVLLAIFIFGGEVIKGFSFALLIGIVIGTYSSICIATPVVIDFDKKEVAERKVLVNNH